MTIACMFDGFSFSFQYGRRQLIRGVSGAFSQNRDTFVDPQRTRMASHASNRVCIPGMHHHIGFC